METNLSLLTALACVQALSYRIGMKQAARLAVPLALLYLVLFAVVEVAGLFAAFFGIAFYEIPFLALVLFLAARLSARALPQVWSAFPEAPEFYLLTCLWVGFAWLALFPSWVGDEFVTSFPALLSPFFWSVYAACALAVLAGLRERLAPGAGPVPAGKGHPLFWVAAGFFLLGFLCFLP